MRGKRLLYAFLMDARGRETLDKWGMELVLDDVSPEITQLEAPKEIESTTPRLTVRATVKPTESRIKDVSFIVNVGTKGDFAKPDSNVVAGKPSSQDPDTWEASLPVPKGATGKLIVSARATSGVGLAGFAHVEIAVKEPVPDPAQADGKPAVEKPGAIEGKVTENDIAQPGLMVYLIDPKAKEKEKPGQGAGEDHFRGALLVHGSQTGSVPGLLPERSDQSPGAQRFLGRVGQDTAARPRSAASVSTTRPIAAMRQDSRAGKKRWCAIRRSTRCDLFLQEAASSWGWKSSLHPRTPRIKRIQSPRKAIRSSFSPLASRKKAAS